MMYIVGLGNPGEKYADTRHNIGWEALDYCIEVWQLPSPVESAGLSGRVSEGVAIGQSVTILYPNTYMNNSGSAVAKLVHRQLATQLVVVHDDIDLPLGEVKVSHGRGAGGNQGVDSIIKKLGTREFARVRIGIAPRSFWTGQVKRPAGGGPLERFVLKPFTRSEQKQLPEVYDRVQYALETILAEGVTAAMNKVN